MRTVVLYHSYYGASRSYAQALAKKLGLEVYEISHCPDLTDCGAVVYIGGLYAGRVAGWRQVRHKIPAEARLYLAAVGLSGGQDAALFQRVKEGWSKHLSASQKERATFFSLPGVLEFSRLHARHKAMMRVFYWLMARSGKATQTLMASKTGRVDLRDKKALLPVITQMKKDGVLPQEKAPLDGDKRE